MSTRPRSERGFDVGRTHADMHPDPPHPVADHPPDSIDRSRLERNEAVRLGKPRDAEQGAREPVARAPEALNQSGEVLEQRVDVGGVEVQPNHVGEGHIGAGEDRFEVVQRDSELSGHVAGVLCVAAGVNGVLAITDVQAAMPLTRCT